MRKASAGDERCSGVKGFWFPARRSVQYCGSTGEAADVVGLDGFHGGQKVRSPAGRTGSGGECDCGGAPVVCHRRSNERWYATLPMDDLFRLIAGLRGIIEPY